MVDIILDASRLESDVIGVKREEHKVAKLIDHARATLEQRATAHKVQISFSVPDNLPNVFADQESIGRVLVNLGANACKFAGENGKIDVWARFDAERNSVTIGVTDTGPGISPEHVKLIFDRFQKVPTEKSKEKDGFGLGLHIASELVRVNFGTLMVESEPKKGSTFSFTLPVFDVNSLIPLHFGFLKTSRHSFQNVSIVMANAVAREAPSLTDAERALNRQLRSYDLLLPLKEGTWLVCIACDDSELAKITERIRTAYAETSRNRADGLLPEIRFRSVGTWPLANRPEGLTDAIRGAYALTPEGRGVH
jgi:anti-sigma regulatory factor (Ser/Thr protein kinase)